MRVSPGFGGDSENIVLLIRGDLLRKYPNTIIYAAAAKRLSGDENRRVQRLPEHLPEHIEGGEIRRLFPGQLAPDVTFLGFNLLEAQVTFGDGLSENILTGYKWLVDNYQPEDRIFLFGFSRGAYSARSLAGLVRNSGILRKEHVKKIDEAYAIYRDKLPPDNPDPARFRRDYSFEPSISFLGVWDTVGSLGIPKKGLYLPGFSDYYDFHDTNLSNKVLAAYHAVAIGEFRHLYAPTLWTKNPESERPSDRPVEQRWFIGAHCNVGGGYAHDTLCNLPCRWLQEMAQKNGLKFLSKWPVSPNDYLVNPRDSYREFVDESPGFAKVVSRVARTIGNTQTIGETVDPSVLKRLAEDPSYMQTESDLKGAIEHLRVSGRVGE